MIEVRLPKIMKENSRLKKQAGFVLTIELILIITILVIGSFVGIAAVRNALFEQKIKQQDRTVLVADSNSQVLGEVINFDEHDAPQLFFIDRTSTDSTTNYRALIGVRDDRFTSREPIYYTELNCQGPPCIKPTSAETLDNTGISRLPNTGSVSYFQALQGAPNYAIGRSPNGLPGFLYKETFEACPMLEIIGGIGSPIGSRYISQKVLTGEPCESPFILPTSLGQPALTCQASEVDISINNVTDNLLEKKIKLGICDAGCGTNTQLQCSCPSGYYSVADGSVDGQCCPTGTNYDDPSFCSGLSLKKAESVININDPTQNALEQFTPPFQVNLPVLGGRVDGDQWYNTAPKGEGNN
ncbi:MULTISPECIES: hypothetical protein [unclassified Colwellia]|uniref:hypothetical protein n=1 Tax=unclassified Colwellia TaxID=196834 RepID=UPI0015F3FC10|nr:MULTISPECIES: hypothetical protein [unclassified Colwellia]MBA6364001.1 hypothetical protein [Colwellia sp. BRX8-8]MBA6352529.1 hypothetical protein [Colwellia sp. BRX9-1]MBA6356514.1 hypothetical protein [Colwellia sp. BRX8-3]MBA6361656.1 hypothetical protein [Colwellia sp. BRX8-6]MBA6367604.1 hypothetical protein [Colwellia sp. BRX8-5]